MTNVADMWNHALGQHRAGNLPAAEESYRQILRLEPTHPDALHNLGVLSHQLGRHQVALDLVRQALALKPTDAAVYQNLGLVYQSLNQWQNACLCHREAVRLEPNNADARFKLGNAFNVLGQLDDAVACFQQALELRPDFAEVYNNLGTVLGRLHRLDEAIACLNKAASLRPDSAEARNNLATALKAQNRLEEAVAAIQEALRLRPNFAAAHHTMGTLHTQMGRHQEAAASFKRAVELDPGDAVAGFLLAALSGNDKPRTAPAKYVTRVFDTYSATFDNHLLNELHYQGPRLLREAIADPPGTGSFDILDLGCGTGLSGLAFKDLARTLTGVDLSTRMLAHAQARGIYQNLIVGDILETLRAASSAYDLLLAGDVFIYLGDMAEVLPAAHGALRAGGRFVFDAEAYDEPGFTLRSSARYAHSLEYIRAQAKSAGFVELSWTRSFLRFGHGKEIDGYVVVLQKPR